jgi:hypothetical protein
MKHQVPCGVHGHCLALAPLRDRHHAIHQYANREGPDASTGGPVRRVAGSLMSGPLTITAILRRSSWAISASPDRDDDSVKAASQG